MDQSLLALIAFTFTASMTPGPNNIMLMASGVNFGFRRSWPHMAGVFLGFPVMVAIVGIGFGATVVALPWFQDLVGAIGIVYLLWLSWHVATSTGISGASSDPNARPLSFLAASAFQWVNPKAWVMAVAVLAVYVPRGYSVLGGLLLVDSVILLMGVVSTVTWTLSGSALAHWLREPARLRAFNWTMAAMLLATLVPAVHDLAVRYL